MAGKNFKQQQYLNFEHIQTQQSTSLQQFGVCVNKEHDCPLCKIYLPSLAQGYTSVYHSSPTSSMLESVQGLRELKYLE